MVDLDYLRETYSGYTTEELIKYLLVKPEDRVPEALLVMKEELQKREVDVDTLIKKEIFKSGVSEFVINKVLSSHITPESADVVGNLYLTSKGIYFIPTKLIDGSLYRAFVGGGALSGGAFGAMLGAIFGELTRKLSEEEVDTETKDKGLPLSLLTRYIEHSYGKDIKDIKSITYWTSGDISIVGTDGKADGFSFNKTNISLIETWISSHKIPAATGKGFFKSILRKLKNKK